MSRPRGGATRGQSGMHSPESLRVWLAVHVLQVASPAKVASQVQVPSASVVP